MSSGEKMEYPGHSRSWHSIGGKGESEKEDGRDRENMEGEWVKQEGRRRERHMAVYRRSPAHSQSQLFSPVHVLALKEKDDCACACFGARACSLHSCVVHGMQSPAERRADARGRILNLLFMRSRT